MRREVHIHGCLELVRGWFDSTTSHQKKPNMRVLLKAVRIEYFVADIGDTPVDEVIDELENGENQTVTVESTEVDAKTPTDCKWDPRDLVMYDVDANGGPEYFLTRDYESQDEDE